MDQKKAVVQARTAPANQSDPEKLSDPMNDPKVAAAARAAEAAGEVGSLADLLDAMRADIAGLRRRVEDLEAKK